MAILPAAASSTSRSTDGLSGSPLAAAITLFVSKVNVTMVPASFSDVVSADPRRRYPAPRCCAVSRPKQ